VKKVALFAFNGDPLCFVHVLLNTLEMNARGYDAKIVFEGAATKLVPELAREQNPLHSLYRQVKEQGLIDAVCRACSTKMGVLADVEREGLPLADEMAGHPSMARYLLDGHDILIF
jgi:hypothetical protein